MTQTVRARFAPSPTGNLHIGGARTALFNWAFARSRGGSFVLRVEDTDRERGTPEFERAILDGLRWLGLDWDEGPETGGDYGPYRQSERIERHREHARALLEAGTAYPCFCAAERLSALREEQTRAKGRIAYDRRCASIPTPEALRRLDGGEAAVIRFRVPPGRTTIRDLIRGEVSFDNSEVDDWIMVRSSGAPTYNFVVVCDDSDMAITHVLRGEEHLVNTPKQALLYRAMQRAEPEFAHLPLMLGTDGKKLSKRTGDTALSDYREQGFPPEAVFNFLCLQGWALDGATEVFSAEEFVRHFEIGDVAKSGAVFDLEKFRWLSGDYIRRDSIERLAQRCAPFLERAGLTTAAELEQRPEWFARVMRAEQERIATYSELPARVAYLFASDAELEWDAGAEQKVRKLAAAAGTLRDFRAWLSDRLSAGAQATDLSDETKAWVQERGEKLGALFQPLRLALTGLPGGPDLFEVMDLLGPERSLARIAGAAERLSGA